MPLFPNKLPDSSEEIQAIWFVGVLAAAAAVARVLYGKDEIGWRRTLASAGVAMFVGMLVYSLAAVHTGLVGGYLGVAIGVSTGLFTDDFLRRARSYFEKKGPLE